MEILENSKCVECDEITKVVSIDRVGDYCVGCLTDSIMIVNQMYEAGI